MNKKQIEQREATSWYILYKVNHISLGGTVELVLKNIQVGL